MPHNLCSDARLPQADRFVNGRQDGHHRRLDDLVLQRGDAERPLSAMRLGYVLPARRQRLRSYVNPTMEVCEVCLQVLRVLGPRHVVHARRGGLLQTQEGRPQGLNADVMKERRQLVLSFLVKASHMRACACGPAFVPEQGLECARPATIERAVGRS
jgi:hypothetical protein